MSASSTCQGCPKNVTWKSLRRLPFEVRPVLKAPRFAAYCPGLAPGRGNTYISELNLAHFPQSTDDLSTNLVRNVELGQGHVAGAEEGILGDRHDARGLDCLSTKGSTGETPWTQCGGSFSNVPILKRGLQISRYGCDDCLMSCLGGEQLNDGEDSEDKTEKRLLDAD